MWADWVRREKARQRGNGPSTRKHRPHAREMHAMLPTRRHRPHMLSVRRQERSERLSIGAVEHGRTADAQPPGMGFAAFGLSGVE